MGEDDDMSDTVEQENDSVKQMAKISQNTAQEQVAFTNAISSMDKTVFNDEIFKLEGEAYYGSDSGGQENRYSMMKAFYTAADYVNNKYQTGEAKFDPESTMNLVDKNMFTNSIVMGGIEEDLSQYGQPGYDDESLIVKWNQEILKDLKPGTVQHKKMQDLSSKWIQTLKLINK